MKYLLLLFFFFSIFSFLHSQELEVEFPDIILKNVETNFTVTSIEEINSITINNATIPLIPSGESQFIGKIQLQNNDILIKEHSTIKTAPKVIPGWLALLPPLIAIALALLFKEVLSSLFIGIYIGAATMGYYLEGVSGIFGAFFAVLDHYILSALANKDHLSIILFSVIIGSIVALISKNGGMQGVVNKLVRFAKNRKSGMLTTYFLGIAIFFDDYANTLVVGNTMRSVTDKLRVSREKLAYIVDSTAAPIAAVAFITTWIGAELSYISDGVEKIEIETGDIITESAYGIFINSLAYSFYPIFSLFFVFFIIQKGKDYGPMLKAERKAIKEGVTDQVQSTSELDEFNPVDNKKIRSFNAIIPILVIVTGTFVGLLVTGLQSCKEKIVKMGGDVESGVFNQLNLISENANTLFQKLGLVIGAADSYSALLWASLLGLLFAIVMTLSQRIMSLSNVMETVIFGIKTMMSAVAILVLAWSLAEITEAMNTAGYIKSFFNDDFNQVWLLPAITFLLSAVIAFSTGSSWSTMALMYPVVIPLAYTLASGSGDIDEMSILYNTIASVLAGSVLGDHCSPISDTTILSSLATSCDHISHVRTQLPYALTVGGVSLFIGIIPAALGVSGLILIPLGIVVMYFIVRYMGRSPEIN
jgi:Na+/H+ antiporter NhaC